MRVASCLLATALLAAPAAAAAGELSLTPYVWIPSIDGKVGTGGGDTGLGDRITVDFSPEFRIGGAMVNFSWREGRATAFGDWTYANVRATSPSPWGALYSEVKGQVIGNVGQAFSGYTLLEGQGMTLDAFVGGRVYGITTRLELEPGLAAYQKLSNSSVWFDACTGIRFNALFAEHWVLAVRADVGAGGSNITYQWYATTGYQFSWGALLAGWRDLYIDRGQGSAQMRLSLAGPVIGANFRF